jgi:Zincin-like metallopeptidase
MRVLAVRFLTLALLAAGMVPSAAAQATVGKATLSTTRVTRTSVIGSGSQSVYNTVSILAVMPDFDLVEARRNSVANLPAAGNSAFVCADLNLYQEPREENAAYIANWLGVLKQDSRAIFTAAAHAQRAADYLNRATTASEAVAA